MVTNSPDEIANRGIELLKEVNTNLGPRLQASVLAFHETYISECLDRLKAHYDTVSVLSKVYLDGKEERDDQMANKIRIEAVKMCRVMMVLQEYLTECDAAFPGERKILPLHRLVGSIINFFFSFFYYYLFQTIFINQMIIK